MLSPTLSSRRRRRPSAARSPRRVRSASNSARASSRNSRKFRSQVQAAPPFLLGPRGWKPGIRRSLSSPSRGRSRPAPTRSIGRRCRWTRITRKARSSSPSSDRFAGLLATNRRASVRMNLGARKTMAMIRFSRFALAFALVAGATPALAQEFKAGDITIDKAWARATPKGADVGAGYLVVHNNGGTPDRLTGGSADFATVEIHEMKMEGGVMTMRQLTDGLNIPAHGVVRLAPSGYHIMFTHLAKPLTKGDKVTAT